MTALASQPASILARRSPRAKFVLPEDSEYEVPEDPSEGPHARIGSIMGLMTKKVNAFLARMRPRERAQYSKVDMLQELWLVLMEKDHYFDPNFIDTKTGRRIRYTTWSDYVINQHLAELSHRARLVQAPRDTKQRLEAPKTQTAEMLVAIHQAIAEVSSLNIELYEEPVDSEDMEIGDSRNSYSPTQIRAAISKLPNIQARLLGWKHGLFGRQQLSMAEIAGLLGGEMTASNAGRLAADAEKAVLEILEGTESSYTSE